MTEEDLISSILTSVEAQIRKAMEKEGDIMALHTQGNGVYITFMNGIHYVQPFIDKIIGLIPETQVVKN